MTAQPKPQRPRAKPVKSAPVDPETERSAIAMLADTFGVVGLWSDDYDGWQWIGGDNPKNQRINELYAVQVTYQGKSWIWAHRTLKAAEKMAATMKGLDVKNVRTWHGKIEWEAL